MTRAGILGFFAKTFRTAKFHWLIFIFAVVVGFMVVSPEIYTIFFDDEFKGVLRIFSDDEEHYLARVRDIVDGHQTLGNAYLAEGKDKPPVQFFLPELMLALPIQFLRMSVPYGFMMYDFILPFAVILLLYIAFFLLCGSRSISFWAAAFIGIGVFFHLLGRPVSPQLILIFWLSQFIFLLLFFREPSFSRPYIWLAALNFGLLFYLYPYYWTFYAALLGATFVLLYLSAFDRLAKRLAVLFGAGVMLGIPYIMHALRISKLPDYEETAVRLGLILTHFPSGIKIIVPSFLVALLIIFFWRKKFIEMDATHLFLFAGLLSSIAVANQHIVTGVNVQFASHYAMGAILWVSFSFVFLLKQFSWRNKTKASAMIAAAIVLGIFPFRQLIFMNWTVYADSLKLPRDGYVHAQNYTSVLEWLNVNTQKDEVVYADYALSTYIPIYTHNNVVHYPYANFYLMSNEEIFERFTLNNFFENIDEDFVKQNFLVIFSDQYDEIYYHTAQENKVRKIFGLKSKEAVRFPERAIGNYLKKAEEVKTRGFVEGLKKYNVHYVVWDKNLNPHWKLDEYGIGYALYSDRNIFIYAFPKLTSSK